MCVLGRRNIVILLSFVTATLSERCCFVLQLLRIIRENVVVIVVGETGSGKTTQLTQVCRLRHFIQVFSVFCILGTFLLWLV